MGLFENGNLCRRDLMERIRDKKLELELSGAYPKSEKYRKDIHCQLVLT